MKSFVPAFQNLWQDLSLVARITFTLTIILFVCGSALLIYTSIQDARTRSYYRSKIILICSNEPRLCEEKK